MDQQNFSPNEATIAVQNQRLDQIPETCAICSLDLAKRCLISNAYELLQVSFFSLAENNKRLVKS